MKIRKNNATKEQQQQQQQHEQVPRTTRQLIKDNKNSRKNNCHSRDDALFFKLRI